MRRWRIRHPAVPGRAGVAGDHRLPGHSAGETALGPPGLGNTQPRVTAFTSGKWERTGRTGMGEVVAFAALITWFAAVLLGLYMLAVWLIENDVTDRAATPSRLPVAIIFTHLFLAAAGLAMWVVFLVLERTMFAWAAIGILGGIAALGATMFLRWIPVYRGPARAASLRQRPGGAPAIPAEGNFPVVIVAAHGLLAVTTLVLALITALETAAPI